MDHKIRVRRLSVDPDLMADELADLHRYWSNLPAQNGFPQWGGNAGQGFRLVDMKNDVLPLMAVVDVSPNCDEFIYRFWGTGRQLYLGNRPDPTGQRVTDGTPKYSGDTVYNQYKEVCTTKQPMLSINAWPLSTGLIAECQTLRLPLVINDNLDRVGIIASATKFIRHAEEFADFRKKLD